MKDSFEEYLRQIGIENASFERAEFVITLYTKLLPEEIRDIFVSEYTEEDGTRIYESLWIFTENFVCEARNFLKDNDIDIARKEKEITYTRWRMKEFNFEGVREKSRLSLDFVIRRDVTGQLKASGENCEMLFTVASRHLIERAES